MIDASRRRVCATGAIVGLLVGSAVQPPRPRLLWNASASAPIGLWWVALNAPIRRGDMVIARLAEPWRSLAAGRRYLPANVPLIKRVAAGPGDLICSIRALITINGAHVATRLAHDRAGRSMPVWRGCQTLRGGAMLLLMDDPASFDGRYFGVTARSDIVGRAYPLWLR